ncbi:MAG: hypothetical protein ACM33B_13965 [Pseudomonadota bacterium]
MHHRRHRGRGFGFGPLGARWYERGNVLERLEGYQRDLEQELADVSDLIQRLRTGDEPAGGPQPSGA